MSEERIKAYIELLHVASQLIQEQLQNDKDAGKDVKKISGTDFEHIVHDHLLKVGFDKENILHSPQKFPDFILIDPDDGDKIGVEVKKTDSNRWEVIGGSIYESLKNDINDTYVMMAKLGGGEPEVRLKRYEDCIADLKVTHSPRFYLKLDLEEGEDFLSQNNAQEILNLTGDELNREIRKLLRTERSTWWSEGETVAFSDLTHDEKEIYLNEGVTLFPEIFKGDYSNFTPWMIYNCLVWCGSVRDIFSAGGIKYVDGLNIYVSAVMARALENIDTIKDRILKLTEAEQMKYWGHSSGNEQEKYKIWLKLVENNLRISNTLIANNKKLDIFDGYDDDRIENTIKSVYLSRLESKIIPSR